MPTSLPDEHLLTDLISLGADADVADDFYSETRLRAIVRKVKEHGRMLVIRPRGGLDNRKLEQLVELGSPCVRIFLGAAKFKYDDRDFSASALVRLAKSHARESKRMLLRCSGTLHLVQLQPVVQAAGEGNITIFIARDAALVSRRRSVRSANSKSASVRVKTGRSAG